MEKIVVGIADGKIARIGQALVSYALGSCVGVCLYDKENKIAAMAHIILPDKCQAVNKGNVYKFAVEGTRELIEEICRQGANRRNLVAKLAGGAKMFNGAEAGWDIGYLNVENVKKTLKEEHIRIIAEDTGGGHGRTITFRGDDGILEVSTVRHAVIYL